LGQPIESLVGSKPRYSEMSHPRNPALSDRFRAPAKSRL
jgi:hypothetical protein